jgi:hypothetical protein
VPQVQLEFKDLLVQLVRQVPRVLKVRLVLMESAAMELLALPAQQGLRVRLVLMVQQDLLVRRVRRDLQAQRVRRDLQAQRVQRD